jgi:hypothetical protein
MVFLLRSIGIPFSSVQKLVSCSGVATPSEDVFTTCYPVNAIGQVGKPTPIGVGFPASCPMLSRASPALNMACFGDTVTTGDATLGVGFLCRGLWHPKVDLYQICRRVCVATLCVGFPMSFPMGSRGSSSLNMVSSCGVATLGVFSNFVSNAIPRTIFVKFGVFFAVSRRWASVFQLRHIPRLFFAWFKILSHCTLSVGFPTPCWIAFLGYSTLSMASNVGVGTIGVAMLLVGLPTSCHVASRGFSWLGFGVLRRRRDDMRYDVWRRFSSAMYCCFPGLVFAKNGILRRRRFANVVSCGFPGVMNHE